VRRRGDPGSAALAFAGERKPGTGQLSQEADALVVAWKALQSEVRASGSGISRDLAARGGAFQARRDLPARVSSNPTGALCPAAPRSWLWHGTGPGDAARVAASGARRSRLSRSGYRVPRARMSAWRRRPGEGVVGAEVLAEMQELVRRGEDQPRYPAMVAGWAAVQRGLGRDRLGAEPCRDFALVEQGVCRSTSTSPSARWKSGKAVPGLAVSALRQSAHGDREVAGPNQEVEVLHGAKAGFGYNGSSGQAPAPSVR